eukprot:jgi/Chlat1/4121/Chrsp269S03956
MNCEVISLKELEVEFYQIREVLRCILHTILFHRALGLVKPRDVDSELFDITYVHCGDPALDKTLEEKIDLFCNWVERQPGKPYKSGQINLSFYEKRHKHIWFGTKEQRLYWEQWCVHLSVVQPGSYDTDAERTRRHKALEEALSDVLLQILRVANDKREHIPPVVSPEVATFPYELTIPSASDSSFGMDMFKRMLQTQPPAMLN